jgi:hypothetical protein
MKYEITDIKHETLDLYRIRAVKDFACVKAGDLGGFIENEYNLSQEGDCWVFDNGCVYGNARVSGDTWVSSDAWVSSTARVFGKARIC